MGKTMKTYILPLALALVVGLFPVASQAACTQTGKLVRVKFKDDSVTGSHVLYMRVETTDTFYYTAKTKDDDVAELAAILAAMQTRVQVKGKAASCPTTGTSRSMGAVHQLIAIP